MNPDNPMFRTYVKCRKCGWISFAVTAKEAADEVTEFNNYYWSIGDEGRAMYGGPSKIENYRCIRCNGSEFRKALDEETNAIEGSTINPVIYEEPAG